MVAAHNGVGKVKIVRISERIMDDPQPLDLMRMLVSSLGFRDFMVAG
jgi:hypothetical protein